MWYNIELPYVLYGADTHGGPVGRYLGSRHRCRAIGDGHLPGGWTVGLQPQTSSTLPHIFVASVADHYTAPC